MEHGVSALRVAFAVGWVAAASAGGADRLDHRTTWIGNDYVYGPGVYERGGHTPHRVEDICVLPDGTVFTNTPWEERGTNARPHARAVHGASSPALLAEAWEHDAAQRVHEGPPRTWTITGSGRAR